MNASIKLKKDIIFQIMKLIFFHNAIHHVKLVMLIIQIQILIVSNVVKVIIKQKIQILIAY